MIHLAPKDDKPMECRVRCLGVYALVVLLSLALIIPPQAHAFWGEDQLITAAIVTGITVGACLLIVLVAGAMIEWKGEPDDVFSQLPIQNPGTLVSQITQPPEPPSAPKESLACLGLGDPALATFTVASPSEPKDSDDIVLLLADSRDPTPGFLQARQWYPHQRRPSIARSRAVFLIDENR